MLVEALDRVDHAEALTNLRAACATGDRSPVTVLNLAIAEHRAGDGDRARALMRGVAALLPEWDEPALRLAESFRRDGLLPQAEQAYATVLEINPRREEALVARAALLIQRGDGAGAQPLLVRCVGINPNRAEAWDALGLALILTGSKDTAESAFAEAQRLAPANLDYAMHRVHAADLAGTLEAEVARLQAAAGEDPLNPVLLAASSLALERSGRRAEAIDSLAAATALAPGTAPLAALSGTLLARANRLTEAARVLGSAIDLDPASPALLNDRAAVLMRLHRHAAAHADLQAALALRPDDPNVLCNLATVLVSLGRQEEGDAVARTAISFAPDAMLPRRTLANALPYRQGVGGLALLAAVQELAARLPRGATPEFPNVADPDRRLKIGLLSGSLRTHPVGWMTIAGFEALDPGGFALVCLAQNRGGDPIARRFRAIAAEWHDVDALDDPALAKLARNRAIDVLIDLGGYGDAGRLPACAWRLAPVQVKWVGMQTHSTGLVEMDWMLSDRWETPPELERFYTERVLRLRDGYVCYSPPPY
ncbi:MAG: tetratricopeptide repeat protein, partial [Acetobacteraceae bacterium]